MSDNTSQDVNQQVEVIPAPRPPHQVSFIIDGVVQETIWTSERFAALLLSNPVIVYSQGVDTIVGQTTYDENTKKFTHPSGAVATPAPFVPGQPEQ